MTVGSVVIPAHNEEAVILRTLTPLEALVEGGVEIIVCTNGCTDRTAEIARTVSGVTVVEISMASKVAALNAGDEKASTFPRIYVDADISITPQTVLAVLRNLGQGDLLAARPPFIYDTRGCSLLVKAYFRARARMVSMSEHLWGAGVYGLSEGGHDRLGRFPEFTSDDLLIDSLFEPSEKAVIDSDPVTVRCPRTTRSLLRVLSRVYRGNEQLAGAANVVQRAGGLHALTTSVQSPREVGDAIVYACFALIGRIGSTGNRKRWERDDTSRDSPGRSRWTVR